MQTSDGPVLTIRHEVVLRLDDAAMEIARAMLRALARPQQAPGDGGPAARVAQNAPAAGPGVERDTSVGAASAGARPREDGSADAPNAAVEGTAADAPSPLLASHPAGEPRAPAALPSRSIRDRRWDQARITTLQALWQVVPPLGPKVLATRISAVSSHLDVLTAQQVSAMAYQRKLPARDWGIADEPVASAAVAPVAAAPAKDAAPVSAPDCRLDPRPAVLRPAHISVVDRQIREDRSRVGVAEVDRHVVRDWAKANGVVTEALDAGEVLRAVNARRREFSLPPFRVITTIARPEPLPPVTLGGREI